MAHTAPVKVKVEVEWAQDRICSQCGKPYHQAACGPTHAVIAHEIWPWLAQRLTQQLGD